MRRLNVALLLRSRWPFGVLSSHINKLLTACKPGWLKLGNLTKLTVQFGPGLDGGDGSDNSAIGHYGPAHLDLLGGSDAGAQGGGSLELWHVLVEQLSRQPNVTQKSTDNA